MDDRNKNKDKPKRLEPGTYDIFEFGKILKDDKNCIMFLDYLHCKDCMERLYQEGKMSEEEYQEALARLKDGDAYEEYLYFKNKFRIINHCTRFPGSTNYRKLPVLMVDKNHDGTYFIHGKLTVKYPSFDELFYDVITGRSPDRERFALIVDAEELLYSAEDIDQAVCGFRVLADSIEVFNSDDALEIFGDWLREAYDSDSCTISGGFY